MARSQHHRLDTDRPLKHLIVLALTAALVYSLNRWFIIPIAKSPAFFQEYLGDILALPVYLPLSVYIAVRLRIIPQCFQLHFGHILGAVILFSIIFEGLVPLFDDSSTRDLLDVAAYLLGGVFVYLTNRLYSKKIIPE